MECGSATKSTFGPECTESECISRVRACVNDYSVGLVMLKKPNRQVYVLDVIRERLDFPALRKRIQKQPQKYGPAVTLIKEVGSRIPLFPC
jgi:hypothetical protein